MQILITEARDFSQGAIDILESAGWKVTARQYDYNQLKKDIGNYEGIIIRLGIKIDQEIIENATRLKFIASPTTGLDHIDLEMAKERGIRIVSLQGETEFLKTITPTAELTVGLILALSRNIVPAVRSVQRGEWKREDFLGREINGKNIGLIGLGRLGSMVARTLSAMGGRVGYYDPYVVSRKYKRYTSLKELARAADIISLHVPLNKNTEGLIDAKFFDHCTNCPMMINTSRGKIWNENDLAEAVLTGKVSAVGTDVLGEEGPGAIKNNVLVKMARKNKNIIITPHLGGATDVSMRKVERFIVQNLLRTDVDGAAGKKYGTRLPARTMRG